MYKEILNVLCCPICKSKFKLQEQLTENNEIIAGSLECENGHTYGIRHGVIDFCSQEQEGFNQWSELIEESDYDALDRKIESQKPEQEKEWQKIHLKSIVQEAAMLKNGYILDIASGRGMLLMKLVENVDTSVNLIATDLSFDILRYDRIKIKRMNPEVRVNYIACDATALPIVEQSIDMTVSFYGVANMMGIVEQGVKEAARITCKDGKFLNGALIIKENSQGFEFLKKVCAENHMSGAERTYLDNELQEIHDKYFTKSIRHIVVEGIYDNVENKVDILPYKNEWFAYVVYEGQK